MGIKQQTFEDYAGFVAKFEPKKTTDDCYTPPAVYDAVRAWAVERYGLQGREIVRPFFPGGDYMAAEYPEGCVVIDNPPFSILAEIMGHYLARGIDFFLFAPGLTCMSAANITVRVNHIFVAESIVYENGAEVKTAFVTNMGYNVAETAPDLSETLKALQKSRDAKPRYEYPLEVLTSSRMERICRRGVKLEVKRSEACHMRRLDAQAAAGKSIFGCGLLLNTAATERVRGAMERAAKADAVPKSDGGDSTVWKLSDRERRIVEIMDGTGAKRCQG